MINSLGSPAMEEKTPMDSEAVSVTVPEETQIGQVQALSHKVFSRGGDDPPSPKYVNNVEFIASGMDVFMDAGTVSPESVKDAIEMKSTGKNPTVNFIVDFRFGMSLQTAVLLHQRLTDLLKAHTGMMKESMEAQTKKGTPAKEA